MKCKYLSDGSQYIDGVPARDLTEAEFKALPESTKAIVLASGLYEVLDTKPQKEK